MAPKPAAKAKKPAEVKKITEDKTFGLKNKKGGKGQKFIATVQKQAQGGAKPTTSLRDKKEELLKEKQEMAKLFKPVVVQKVDGQTDPKSVLCAFFKQGLCTKGTKCKFSHDVGVERKAEKRNMFDTDTPAEGGMDDWDEEKMNEVISKKHGESNLNRTDIVCKHFLEAVENSKYGWFWECPGGDKCMYRHALPPGYVLKKDKKAAKDQEVTITLEELIEQERSKLSGEGLIKVTLESFMEWKKRRRAAKRKALDAKSAKRKKDYTSGRTQGLSGRELFTFDPSLIAEVADEDADGADVFDLRQYEKSTAATENGEADPEEGVEPEPEFKEVAFDESLFGDDLDDLEEEEEGREEELASGVQRLAL